jgi:polysaccharide biosynthesis protein PelE
MIAPLAILLSIIALVLEIGAIYFVANVPQGTGEVIAFLCIHACASVVFAFVVRGVLPPRFRTPRWAVLALLASFAFFIPIFGLLALAAGVLTVLATPRGTVVLPFDLVRRPEYSTPLRESGMKMRATGLRTLLLDATLAPELRLRSLMALQNLPIRRAGPMLRRLLGDPSDDMRLTAYGLLERESKRIGDIIQREIELLPTLAERGARVSSQRRIAEHYWELVYTGLAQGDLGEFAIDEGVRYADQAIGLAPNESGLWILKGRLHNARGNIEGARTAYAEAARLGTPADRIAPYLAEIAYERGDYAEVRRQMQRLGATPMPAAAPIARFWSQPSARGHRA